MELRHLRYFIAVAEKENMTRAAAQLHVSQPPLSRQIRDLEDELGVALFDHGAKAVRLTEAGRVFLNEARAVVERANEAVQIVKAVAGGKRGEIHVGYVSALTTEILPRALRLFHEANPYVRVQLHDMSMQEVLQGLSEEKLNVALVEQVPRKLMTGLTFEELHRDPVCLAAHPAHPLAHVRKVGLEQVARERLIGFAAANYPDYRDWLAALFAPLKLAPQVAEEYASATSVMAAVEAGRGLALVTQSFTRWAGPRLKVRPLTPAPPALIFGIAYRKGVNSPAVRNFIAAAKRIDSC
jgi:DNA-binding transcriptional LysR family regulator